jgi:hypothetical protein
MTDAIDVPHRMVNGTPVPLTAEEIAARAAEEAAYVAPPKRWDVPKLLVIDRLRAAGLLRLAYMALQLDTPVANLTDDELALRERWNAARDLGSDDADARAFFSAIGADADVILARP